MILGGSTLLTMPNWPIQNGQRIVEAPGKQNLCHWIPMFVDFCLAQAYASICLGRIVDLLAKVILPGKSVQMAACLFWILTTMPCTNSLVLKLMTMGSEQEACFLVFGRCGLEQQGRNSSHGSYDFPR
jgi:hypothetical protein